jgi:hypothetical protein
VFDVRVRFPLRVREDCFEGDVAKQNLVRVSFDTRWFFVLFIVRKKAVYKKKIDYTR